MATYMDLEHDHIYGRRHTSSCLLWRLTQFYLLEEDILPKNKCADMQQMDLMQLTDILLHHICIW